MLCLGNLFFSSRLR